MVYMVYCRTLKDISVQSGPVVALRGFHIFVYRAVYSGFECQMGKSHGGLQNTKPRIRRELLPNSIVYIFVGA